MAAAQVSANIHRARAFAPQLLATCSAARAPRGILQGQQLCRQRNHTFSRQSIATAAFPSWVPFIGKQRKQGSNNPVLNWARTTRMACQVAPANAPAGQDIATFAGGCFWGVELAFQRVPGVTKTSVGYTAGHDTAPTYNSVCSGQTGHTEAVQVYYDPKETDYTKLLDTFFQHVDPTTLNQQGADRGTQYRSGIYYHNEEQKAAAQKTSKQISCDMFQAIAEVNEKLKSNVFRRVIGSKVVSELEPASDYYIAENYHQQYLEKGGRFSRPQDASKGATEKIRCYG